MVRLSKLADYGLVVMACIARRNDKLPLRTARDLALESRLPLPTVTRLLKCLLQAGLLVSQRGYQGGYSLARPPRSISLLDIIAALEGPVALTECSTEVSGLCTIERCCLVREHQRIISQVVRGVFQTIALSDLVRPFHITTIQNAPGGRRPVLSVASGRSS